MNNVVESAKSIAGLVAEDASAAEEQRRLTPRVLAALRAAGLLKMGAPASVGGGQVDPPEMLRAIEQLAIVDGGTAWCAMIASTSSVVAGHLDDEVAKDVFGDAGDLLVGPFAPQGTATVVNGDYVVSGRWSYASMCLESTWIMMGTRIEGGERRLVVAPTRNVRIHDTWRVLGLRATGSHDVEVTDEVVPRDRSVSLTLDAPVASGALYVFPIRSLLAAGIATVALGIGRGALDAFRELAVGKTPVYSIRRLRENPLVQTGVAGAEAQLRAARCLLQEAVVVAWDAARSQERVPLDLQLDVRLAAAHATTTARQVVDAVYEAGGGSSVYEAGLAQRRLRDVHTATQHVMVASSQLEVAGRAILGLKVDPSQV